MKYHGEVFDDGRRTFIIESDLGYAPIVMIKLDTGPMTAEFVMDTTQALELSRHLALAVEAISPHDRVGEPK